MYDTILAATDGSDAANRAIEHAIDLASSFDADFHAIYVVDTTRYGQAVLSESDGALDDLEQRGEGILDDVAARSDTDITSEIRRGRPAEEIDAYAAAIGPTSSCSATADSGLAPTSNSAASPNESFGTPTDR